MKYVNNKKKKKFEIIENIEIFLKTTGILFHAMYSADNTFLFCATKFAIEITFDMHLKIEMSTLKY